MGSSLKTSIQSTRENSHLHSRMVDEAKVKYVCDIYDWDGKGEIDLFFLGDICYALGLNITKKACVGQDRLMRRARSSPSTMMLSRRSRPLLPPLTPRDPTLTMLSSSSSTTKTATAP